MYVFGTLTFELVLGIGSNTATMWGRFQTLRKLAKTYRKDGQRTGFGERAEAPEFFKKTLKMFAAATSQRKGGL